MDLGSEAEGQAIPDPVGLDGDFSIIARHGASCYVKDHVRLPGTRRHFHKPFGGRQ
jgi:hypothetical protein